MVKNLPTMRETWVQSLSWKDPLEKAMATHFSILSWKIPWTEKHGSYSPQISKESDTTEQHSLSLHFYIQLSFLLFSRPYSFQAWTHCPELCYDSATGALAAWLKIRRRPICDGQPSCPAGWTKVVFEIASQDPCIPPKSKWLSLKRYGSF